MKDSGTRLSTMVRAVRHYNRYKKGIMLENDPVGARVMLYLLPLSVHINHPGLPGYMGDMDCPCGIKGMEWPADTIRKLSTHFSTRINLSDMHDFVPRHREIEGLYTIGSVGSLGQTKESDYDIWVVIDTSAIGKARLKLLETKLHILRREMTSKYLVDVHFFLMDICDIQVNNFGEVSHEGSGSALKNILKEEFYRTMTIIEGRIPLWWIVRSGSDPDVYDKTFQNLHKTMDVEADEFIDMGNLTRIPQQELLGAALWQMHKALDDPLKSVLKMALVATYLEQGENDQLLCEVLKENILHAKRDDIVDPYLEIFKRVEAFYSSKDDYKTVDILRKCFYMKVCPNIKVNDLLKLNQKDKATITVDVVKSWGWSLNIIKSLNEFEEGGVEEYRAFGDDIHEYLKKTTVQLIRKAKAFLLNSSLDEDVEMEILRRRVEVFYVSKNDKIECEKRVKKREPCYKELFFYYKDGIWSVSGAQPEINGENTAMNARRIVNIIAWLVYNRRFDASTAFHMIPNSSYVALSDVQTLLWKLKSLIPAANTIGLDREALLQSSFVKHLIIVGNMEMPNALNSIDQVDVISISSWDELFCYHIKPRLLKEWIKTVKTQDTKINLWLPRETNSKYLIRAIYSLIS